MRAQWLAGASVLFACSAPLKLPELDQEAPYVHPMDLPATAGLPELLTLSTGERVETERRAGLDYRLTRIEEGLERLEKRLWLVVYGVASGVLVHGALALLVARI